jgi:hypothetical protein
MDDKTRDENWEKAWEEASDFERRRYHSLDWKGSLGVLMPVSDGASLGEAISTAAPFAADWTPPER